MSRPMPASIAEFLEQLRLHLLDADPALVQDALYDAEEYLREACAEQPGRSEAEVLAGLRDSFGTPAEVAAAWRDTEHKVAKALRTPEQPKPTSLLGKIFGVYADPRTYGSLFYMFLTLATGIFYFTWAVTGLSMSVGLAILIIGVPFFLLFLASVRLISLVEGRVVEVLLGERMPRRPLYPVANGWLERITLMLKDGRTWLTVAYMLVMMPLGIAYFTVAVTGLATSVGLIAAPLVSLFVDNHGWHHSHVIWVDGHELSEHWLWLAMPAGFTLLTLLMHGVRFVGQVHGKFAKHLLVKV